MNLFCEGSITELKKSSNNDDPITSPDLATTADYIRAARDYGLSHRIIATTRIGFFSVHRRSSEIPASDPSYRSTKQEQRSAASASEFAVAGWSH